MSSPRLEIFQFEKQAEMAAQAYALTNGINDPKKQQDNDKDGLKTPRVEFKYVWGGYNTEHYWLRASTTEKWFDLGKGTLHAKVVTRRGDEKQDHYGMLALIRSLFVDCTDPSAFLPWHRYERMVDSGANIGTISDEYQDATSLSFDTVLRILFDTKESEIFLTP